MEEEEEGEYQEAEILWPESYSGHEKAEKSASRAKKRRKSRPREKPVRGDHKGSYSWTQGFAVVDYHEVIGGDKGGWKGIVPPHVVVERRAEEKTALSVCVGNGRTLKGRDLRQVRDAVLRMTGFLER